MVTLNNTPLNIDEFCEYLQKYSRQNTATTYANALVDYHRWLGSKSPTKENAQRFIDHMKKMGKSPNTIATRANAIRRWFKWRGEEISLDAPTPHIAPPEYVTKEQLHLMINACQGPLEKILIIGLFDTACRINEWLTITVDDINWEGKMVKVVRKGGREAWVNISDPCVEALSEWLDERKGNSRDVFMDIDYNMANRVIRRIGDRVGINIHAHMLRHSRAIQMLLDGADMYVVQQTLGHVDIATTMNIYGQMMPVHLKSKIPSWEDKS